MQGVSAIGVVISELRKKKGVTPSMLVFHHRRCPSGKTVVFRIQSC